MRRGIGEITQHDNATDATAFVGFTVHTLICRYIHIWGDTTYWPDFRDICICEQHSRTHTTVAFDISFHSYRVVCIHLFWQAQLICFLWIESMNSRLKRWLQLLFASFSLALPPYRPLSVHLQFQNQSNCMDLVFHAKILIFKSEEKPTTFLFLNTVWNQIEYSICTLLNHSRCEFQFHWKHVHFFLLHMALIRFCA